MMFRRARSDTWLGGWFSTLRRFIWPRKGYYRGWIYLLIRVLRIRASDYSLAAGLACGAAVSFTPLLGLHLFLAIFLAWVIRGNLLVATIGTVIGNPWSFPFIWALIYAVGRTILGTEQSVEDVGNLSYDLLMNSPGEVFFAMSAGGLFVGSIVWLVVFFAAYLSVGKIRLRYARFRARKKTEEA